MRQSVICRPHERSGLAQVRKTDSGSARPVLRSERAFPSTDELFDESRAIPMFAPPQKQLSFPNDETSTMYWTMGLLRADCVVEKAGSPAGRRVSDAL